MGGLSVSAKALADAALVDALVDALVQALSEKSDGGGADDPEA
jgi:hypothetical protein